MTNLTEFIERHSRQSEINLGRNERVASMIMAVALVVLCVN